MDTKVVLSGIAIGVAITTLHSYLKSQNEEKSAVSGNWWSKSSFGKDCGELVYRGRPVNQWGRWCNDGWHPQA